MTKQEKDKPTKLTPNREITPSPRRRREFSRPGPSQSQSKRPGRGRPQGTLRKSSRPEKQSSPIVSQAAEPKESSRPGPSQSQSKTPGRPQKQSSPIVSQAAKPKESSRPGPSQSQSERPGRGRPQGTLRTSSRPQKQSSPIVSQAAAPKGPKETRRQVDTAAAKDPQQGRGAARGQVSMPTIPKNRISKLILLESRVRKLARPN